MNRLPRLFLDPLQQDSPPSEGEASAARGLGQVKEGRAATETSCARHLRRFAVEALCLLMLLYGAPLQALESALPQVSVDLPDLPLEMSLGMDSASRDLQTARQATADATLDFVRQPWADAFTMMLTASSLGATQETSAPPSPPSGERSTKDYDLAVLAQGFPEKDALDAIPLLPGWNQISLPKVPSSSAPATVLAAIGGSYSKVYAYSGCDADDPWKVYDPADLTGSDLTAIDVEQGLLIDSTAAVSLPSDGTLPDGTTLTLCTGWNLIGFPSAHPRHVRSALAPILDKVVRVFAFDPFDLADNWKFYEASAPAWASDLDTMVPGQGYWILVTEDVTFEVKNVGEAPDIAFTTPVDLDVVTAPTGIHGSVASDLLESWQLRYRGVGENDWIELASGNYPVDGKLGDFDPTLLLNGMYELELIATDLQGLQVTDSITVVVEGNMKIGHFTLSFVDLAIPLSGLDIEVVRTYDSRQRHLQGDFGYGWSLDIRQGSYRNNRPPGDGWQIRATEGPWGLPCSRDAIQETKSHLTAIRLSDQEVYRFRLVVEDPGTIIGGCIGRADFEYVDGPIPGAVLEILGNTSVLYQNNTDELRDPNTFELYVPEDVKLTTRDGRIFHLDLNDGVTHLEDLNGNTLDITPEGITHSSGRGVEFERDAEGRIERIIDPMGNGNVYGYDADGDHVIFTDRAGAETQLSYADDHYLEDIVNALGVRAVRTEYDEDGRMVRMIDAAGKVTSFEHNLDVRREVATNRLGFSQVLEYDSRGNVVRQIDGAGAVTLYTYNEDGLLLSETSPLGYRLDYLYDANSDLRSITDSSGRTQATTYDHQGRTLQQTYPGGHTSVLTYDAGGNLASATDREGHVTQFFYNAAGDVIREVNALGHEVTKTYDNTGALTRWVSPLGAETAMTYDASGQLLTLKRTATASDGSTEDRIDSWQYDDVGREVAHTAADGSTMRRTYNALGNVETVVDALGRVTRFEYDPQGRKTRVEYPDGSDETVSYDAEGQPVRFTDRLGRETSVTYDPVGRPLTMTYPDGTTARIEYDAGGRRIATIDGRGQRTEMTYDLSGRLTQITDAMGNTRSMTYDLAGRLQRVENPRGYAMEFESDREGRQTRLSYPDGTTQVVVYDALGQRISETDRSGQTTLTTWDSLGNLIKITDAMGQEVTMDYNGFGQRISEKATNGQTTLFEYDNVGRLTARTLPSGKTERLQYLADGSLSQHEAFDGIVRHFEYDSASRLVRHSTNASDQVEITYTPTGQVASMADGSGTLTFAYDARDRIIEKVDPQGHRLNYAYDAVGNLTLFEVTVGAAAYSTSYSYDAVNRLINLEDGLGNITTIGYDPNGNRTSIHYPNSVSKTLTYDALDQLTAIQAVDETGQTLESFQYTLGPGGRRARLETLEATHTYVYDSLHRLIRETKSDLAGTQIHQMDYSYDALGNRLDVTRDGNPTPAGYDVDDQQLTSGTEAFNWDARGRLMHRGHSGTEDYFQWDSRDHLISADLADGTEVTYRFDAANHWIGQTTTLPGEAPKAVDYVVDTHSGRSHIVAEVSAGQINTLYTRLDHQLLSLSNAQTGAQSYSLFDGQGSIRSLMDDQGVVTDRYEYDGYGELVSHLGDSPNPYRYVGERQEPNSGLYHLRARWMDPEQGRFLTIDPVLGDAERPLSLNRYLYAEADPMHRIDPMGTQSFLGFSVASAVRGALGSVRSFLLPVYQSLLLNVGRSTFFFINNAARIELGTLLGTTAFAFIDVGTRYILNNIEIVPIGDNEPGGFVERKMGANATGYEIIDDFRDGTATSIKTRQANRGAANLLKEIEKDARRFGNRKLFEPIKQHRENLPEIPASAVRRRVLFVVIPENRVSIAVSPTFLRSLQRIQAANNVVIRVVPLRRWRR